MVNTHLYFEVMLERVKDTWVYDRPLGFYNVQDAELNHIYKISNYCSASVFMVYF